MCRHTASPERQRALGDQQEAPWTSRFLLGDWKPAKVPVNAFLFTKELQIPQLSNLNTVVRQHRQKGAGGRSFLQYTK